VNYARRQQYRRLSRACKAALGSVVAGLLGLAFASAGAAPLAALLLLTAVGLGLYARHWLSLVAVESELGPRTRCRARSPPSRRRAGGCGTRCRGRAAGTSTPSRGPDRSGGRNRDEDQDLRRAPPCPRARAGGVAGQSPAKMVPPWHVCSAVSCSNARRRPRRGRCAGGLDRPASPSPQRCGTDAFRDPLRWVTRARCYPSWSGAMAPTVAANVHAITAMHPLGARSRPPGYSAAASIFAGSGAPAPTRWGVSAVLAPSLLPDPDARSRPRGQSRPRRPTLQTSREVMSRGCWAPHRPGEGLESGRPASARTSATDR
jgi:hypothetical protein